MTDRLVGPDPARWNIHETFRTLRRTGPVQPVLLPGDLTAWMVTGAQPVAAALTDPRLVHDLRRLPAPEMGFGGRRRPDDIFAVEGRHLLNSDGADHRRLRSVVTAALAHSRVTPFRPLIEQTAGELLDRADDRFDLVADYARPLAARVTAAVLGIPGRHLEPLTGLTLAAINAPAPEVPRRELFRLWVRVLADKRRERADDLLTQLLLAQETGRMSAQELVSVAWGLFSGGVSPSTTLVTLGAVELLDAPHLRPALSDDVQADLLIDELLRLTSPFPVAQWRFAIQDVGLDDTLIPAGAVVLPALAAANRDPERFPDPDRAGAGRAAHFAFGARPHYCPGAALARLHARIALTTLFTRRPGLRRAVPETDLRWHGVLVERCYDAVPVLDPKK